MDAVHAFALGHAENVIERIGLRERELVVPATRVDAIITRATVSMFCSSHPAGSVNCRGDTLIAMLSTPARCIRPRFSRAYWQAMRNTSSPSGMINPDSSAMLMKVIGEIMSPLGSIQRTSASAEMISRFKSYLGW